MADKDQKKPTPEEVKIFAAHWPEILQEMNRMLAEEDD
jgi:hypothetical protein